MDSIRQDRMLRGQLHRLDSDRTPAGNDPGTQAGMDFGPPSPLSGKKFIHDSIRCVADMGMAKWYRMRDGNSVLAYCEVSANEFYSALSHEAKTGRREESKDDPTLL